jgi:hypothetical protein
MRMRHYALCFATWLLHKFSTGEIETSSAPSLYMLHLSKQVPTSSLS